MGGGWRRAAAPLAGFTAFELGLGHGLVLHFYMSYSAYFFCLFFVVVFCCCFFNFFLVSC